MAWWRERLVGFDLETTGPDPEDARIVQASLVMAVPHALHPERYEWLVNPGVPIPAEAADIHGITDERVVAEGVPAAEAVRGIAEAVALSAQWPLVIFNAPYDLTVLDRECRRYGIGPLPVNHGFVVDPLLIDKHLDRYRKGSRKLDAVCAAYGAKTGSSHDAADDALAACRCAWVLLEKGYVKRRVRGPREGAELMALEAEWDKAKVSPEALFTQQAVWAQAQQQGLSEYFAKQGNAEAAADVLARRWPLTPVSTEVA